MLDYTLAVFNKTKRELETALTAYQFGTQIIYIAYLLYLMIVPNNIWYLHLSLLIVSGAFLAFDIVTTKEIKSIRSEKISLLGKRRHNARLAQAKKHRSNVKRIKFYTSHFIKLFVLASAFYPIIVSPDTVHPLSIMATTVMVLLWILQIIFEVLKLVLEGRGELFIEALHADVEFVTKPVNAVKDTFKRILGKEVEEAPEPTKERVYLDKLVSGIREEKSAKKAEAKEARSEKLASWADKHLSKIAIKRVSKSAEDDNELPTAEEDDREVIEAPKEN